MLNGKPLICISSDMKKMESDPRRLITETYQTYSDAVFYAGGIPMITCGRCAEEMADLCDGLLITGGPDLEPEVYGEQPLNDTVKPMPERTAFEKPLFQAFLDRGKPILGICRGCQFINAVMGGTLYQDLVEQKGWVHFNAQIRHEVYAEEGSVLYRLFGPKFRTNSTHHQAVKDLAPGFHVTARSVEGIVEAYEHDTLPILATQFHPERLTGILWDDRTPDFRPWFEYFVELVRKHAEK
ncbi:MAG: gamma-glutamyl-gamma-aminobutyrate hydrolase family protein [Clostridiaceae bacterium]|nr:gamma-glutamyl-gamma-aminobutyrate hydrolase family protein [Clostridiaceae bacterium]